jgi:hypothetical protein
MCVAAERIAMLVSQLRSEYLAFFESKGHVPIASASLVPANDPTVLFTTAGMHPLVPYLLGEPHPAGRRLVGTQRCVRTGDLVDSSNAYVRRAPSAKIAVTSWRSPRRSKPIGVQT